jgi:AraC-like DNA-binding protein
MTSDSKAGSGPMVIEHLVTEPLVGHAAFGQWHDMTQPVFELGHLEPRQGYRVQSEWIVVDGLMFTRVKFGASTYRRTHRHIRGGDQDYFHLHMPFSGVERGQAHHQPLLVGPDRITLQDWSRPYYTVTQPTEKYGLLIPRERIERRDWVHERCPVISWPRSSLAGAALASAWQTLWSSLVAGQTEIAPKLTTQFVELVNKLVDMQWRQASPPAQRDMLLSTMMEFLDERLDQEQLGLSDLIGAFGCSRATTHRLFTSVGGVRTYIRNQRLARCFAELALTPQSGRFIYEVAERWGFCSAAHFSRAFRNRFGLGPLQLRDSALTSFPTDHHATSDSRNIAQVHRWLIP